MERFSYCFTHTPLLHTIQFECSRCIVIRHCWLTSDLRLASLEESWSMQWRQQVHLTWDGAQTIQPTAITPESTLQSQDLQLLSTQRPEWRGDEGGRRRRRRKRGRDRGGAFLNKWQLVRGCGQQGTERIVSRHLLVGEVCQYTPYTIPTLTEIPLKSTIVQNSAKPSAQCLLYLGVCVRNIQYTHAPMKKCIC